MVVNNMLIVRLSTVLWLALMASACATQGARQQTFVSAAPVAEEYAQRADTMYEILVGELATRQKNYESAVKHYSKASQTSDDPRVAEQAAKIALFARNYEVAQAGVERWLELSPASPDAIQLSGLINLRLNNKAKAVESFSKMIAADPDHGFEEVERILAGNNRSKITLEVMDALRLQFPDNVSAHLAYANLAFRRNKYTEAMEAIKQVETLGSGNRNARLLKNRIRIARGEADEAIADMSELVSSAGNDAELLQIYARMLVQAKFYDKALETYGQVLKNSPDDADVIFTTALLEVELKKNAAATVHFKQLLKVETHADDASYYLGRLTEDNPEAALKWYKQVKQGQYFVDAQISIAGMLAEQGETVSARQHLTRLRGQQTHQGLIIRLYLVEGQLLRNQEKYLEAIKLYDEALKQHAGNIDLLYARGMTAEQAGGMLDLVERDLTAIIGQEPDNAMALNALGYTLAEQTDRLDEARILIEKAFVLEPDDPAIIDSMGWVLYRQGDLVEALVYLRKAFSMLNDPEVASHLATVLWEMGKLEQARATVEKALLVSPDDARLLELKDTLSLAN